MHQIGRNAAIAVFLFFTTCASAAAASISLFDDSLGTLPSEQGSLVFAGIGGSQTVSAAGVDLNTTLMENTGQIGYSNIGALELDRSTGVNLSLELQVNVENHATPDRSGFSIIVITNDLYGIELAFWQDEVWAQNAGFTHGEGAAYDTTAALTSYSLEILGSGYALFADDTELLSGALRNYSGAGLPYSLSNFVFLGDNTTSARGAVTLGDISLSTAFVPLPPSIGLMLAACLGLVIQRRRNRIPGADGQFFTS